MISDRFDDLTRSFSQKLFAVHPEWRKFAAAKKMQDRENDYLIVEVPSPNATNLSRSLEIFTHADTTDYDVTIIFDYFHAHYSWPCDENVPTTNPFDFLEKLLSEDFAAVSTWNGDKRSSGYLLKRGDDPMPRYVTTPVKRLRVRSWKGTLDCDYDVNIVPAT